MSEFVRTLLPSLSQSLAEQFNVFRVMHHGTHEKQLSNIFAWLLATDATHELGDAVQRAFLARVNSGLRAEAQLPPSGYRVVQEVDTRGESERATEVGMDIADVVLSRPDAAIVIENYGTSDGHGHDYQRYLAHGATSGRTAVVVLLCHRHEPHLLRDGWEQAVVVTYADVLTDVQAHIDRDPRWQRQHPEQHFFIQQMVQHFVEGPVAVNVDDQISFITAMCETGESARYGYRPQDRAADEFANLVADHARQQFEQSRETLGSVKAQLSSFARTVLVNQVNGRLQCGRVERIVTRFVGQWEWCVALVRADARPTVALDFGPTAVVKNQRVPEPLAEPDYSRVFVSLLDEHENTIVRIAQTDVALVEVIQGLAANDDRLCNAVSAMAE